MSTSVSVSAVISTTAVVSAIIAVFTVAASSQPIRDMDLLSEGTAPITADKAMTVIEERMKVRSRGNPKE
jgi:hypothetical protein